MKKVFLYIVIAVGFTSISAQNKPQHSPLNPEFLNYVKNSVPGEKKKSTDGFSMGYVPSPMNIHFNAGETAAESKKSLQSFPAHYDLRDSGWVTPVRNQGPVGACWSFSTMGAIESRWLKLGFGNQTLDLSEQNMATCHGFEAGMNDGGSDYIAAAYLSRLSGPVTEASDPYVPDPNSVCISTGLVYPAFSPQTIWLPKDINIIKKAILDYGAVTASVYMGLYTHFYNTVDKTYFYKGTSPVDHAVLVVGWDDNKVVTGKTFKPVNKGAWIVKNSWGLSFGDKGYFYVSYEDSKFLSSCSYYPERIEVSDVDKLVMYDWLGATESYGFRKETASGVARFETSGDEFLNKIGTFINASGSVVDVDIYKEFIGDSIPNDLVASSHNNFCKFPGYYTFDIPALLNGTYYVKVKYYTPGYNYPIPVEAKIEYQGVSYALPTIEPSGRFWISSDEEKWQPLGSDLPDWSADLCIRAYTNRTTTLNPFFTANRSITCVGGDVVFTDASNGTINSYLWDFGSGASPATANTAGPHTVTYSTPGLKDISLTITGPGGTKTLIKKSYVEAVTALDIFLPYSEKLLVNGKSLTISAFGADNYSWAPPTGLNTTVGSTVVASPVDTTTYTVTGTMGTCTGSASITLNVVQNPVNDDVCNAIHIIQGGGLYNNIYATVEDGEPAPPEGDCNTPLQWCVEGGLQNSVWFWLTGPASGKVSLTTVGMDSQIAMYKADICDSILLGGYKMIAANDDYFGEDKFFAAALDQVSVEPGQKYFVQVDGSAGGVEGEFYLIFWESPLSSDAVSNQADLKLYPNPSNGIFKFSYNSADAGNLRIRILNSKGQEIYQDNLKNSSQSVEKEINLGKITPGFYIFELTSGPQVVHRNFLVQ